MKNVHGHVQVPGVTFPVADVWWTAQPWLPRADGAIESLALETIRIYLLVGAAGMTLHA